MIEPVPRRIDIDHEQLEAALARSQGSRSAAARDLGISVATLARRLRDAPLLKLAPDQPSPAELMDATMILQAQGSFAGEKALLLAVGWGATTHSVRTLEPDEFSDLVAKIEHASRRGKGN